MRKLYDMLLLKVYDDAYVNLMSRLELFCHLFEPGTISHERLLNACARHEDVIRWVAVSL